MKLHKAILIQQADKLMVRVWDSQEPIQSSDAIRQWNDSYKEYEVHPDYVSRFKALEQGIDLDPDLIEIKFWFDKYNNPAHSENYVILKDKPFESEDDEVWDDLLTDVNELDYWELKRKYTLKRK